MHIREAGLGDESGIADVQVRTWQVAYRGQLPDSFLDAMSVEDRAARWRTILAASDPPRRHCLVAEDGAGIVGFAHVSPSRDDDAPADTGELTAIYLLPEHWGRGVGRQLIGRATEALAQAGFTWATLWVLESNDRARRFYQAAGWATDGRTQVTDIGGHRVSEVRYGIGLGDTAR